MKAIFEAIEDLFVNVLFAPYDLFRFMDSWWSSNIINWLFVIIGFIALFYWMQRLNIFASTGEEDKSISSHSYL